MVSLQCCLDPHWPSTVLDRQGPFDNIWLCLILRFSQCIRDYLKAFISMCYNTLKEYIVLNGLEIYIAQCISRVVRQRSVRRGGDD